MIKYGHHPVAVLRRVGSSLAGGQELPVAISVKKVESGGASSLQGFVDFDRIRRRVYNRQDAAKQPIASRMCDQPGNCASDSIVRTTALMVDSVPIVHFCWPVETDRYSDVVASEQVDEVVG